MAITPSSLSTPPYTAYADGAARSLSSSLASSDTFSDDDETSNDLESRFLTHPRPENQNGFFVARRCFGTCTGPYSEVILPGTLMQEKLKLINADLENILKGSMSEKTQKKVQAIISATGLETSSSAKKRTPPKTAPTLTSTKDPSQISVLTSPLNDTSSVVQEAEEVSHVCNQTIAYAVDLKKGGSARGASTSIDPKKGSTIRIYRPPKAFDGVFISPDPEHPFALQRVSLDIPDPESCLTRFQASKKAVRAVKETNLSLFIKTIGQAYHFLARVTVISLVARIVFLPLRLIINPYLNSLQRKEAFLDSVIAHFTNPFYHQCAEINLQEYQASWQARKEGKIETFQDQASRLEKAWEARKIALEHQFKKLSLWGIFLPRRLKHKRTLVEGIFTYQKKKVGGTATLAPLFESASCNPRLKLYGHAALATTTFKEQESYREAKLAIETLSETPEGMLIQEELVRKFLEPTIACYKKFTSFPDHSSIEALRSLEEAVTINLTSFSGLHAPLMRILFPEIEITLYMLLIALKLVKPTWNTVHMHKPSYTNLEEIAVLVDKAHLLLPPTPEYSSLEQSYNWNAGHRSTFTTKDVLARARALITRLRSGIMETNADPE